MRLLGKMVVCKQTQHFPSYASCLSFPDTLFVKSSGDPSLEPLKLSTDFLQSTEVQPEDTKQEVEAASDSITIAADATTNDEGIEQQNPLPSVTMMH